MRPLNFLLAVVLFASCTLASGWLHGRLTNRWGEAEVLRVAADRLGAELPARLGPWRLVKNYELEQNVAEALQCVGYLHGAYTNDQTGDTVVVAVIGGPGGRISVHTPEICYSAQDYELVSDRQQLTIHDESEKVHTFWQLVANSRVRSRPDLRVLYGWSDGSSWQAVAGPRFAFAGLPLLYKLQLAGPPQAGQADPALDPCQDFLARLVHDLQPRLVSASRSSLFAK
jgi:hypothetical protein